MNVQPYDFRKPGRPAIADEQRLVAWFRAACSAGTEKLAKQLPFRAELVFDSLDPIRPADCVAQLPEATIGFRVAVHHEGANSLLVLPRPLALALVTAMLGDVAAELPPDRALTAVEQSLAEYLVQELLAAFRETWPGTEPLTAGLDGTERNLKQTRLFRSGETVLSGRCQMRGPFGEQAWGWILPQDELLAALNRTETEDSQATSARPKLELLAREMSVEIAVGLGTVELDVAQIAKLRAGDLVILDQRVSDPLPARVAGEAKFRVWPGRVGSRQAFQIESLLEC